MSEESTKPIRPLSCLTDAECQALFAVAFGHTPPAEHIQVLHWIAGPTILVALGKTLSLYPDGQVRAAHCPDENIDEGVALAFNAWKLIKLLEAYNIHLGGYAPEANPSTTPL